MNIFKTFFGKEKPKQKYIRQYKIAGVTFNNEDGISRQKLIKEMHDGDLVKIEKYIYNNKLAIKIMNENNQQIGNVSENDINNLLNIYDKTNKTEIFNIGSFINEFGKKIYYAELIVHFIE